MWAWRKLKCVFILTRFAALSAPKLLLGPVFSSFSDTAAKPCLDAIKLVTEYTENGNRFRSILERTTPVLQRFGYLDVVSEDQEVASKLQELLETGKELGFQCSQVNEWNPFERFRYSKKLLNFVNDLREFSQLEVSLDMFGDLKEIHRDQEDIMNDVISIRMSVDEVKQELGSMRRQLASEMRSAITELRREEKDSLQLINYSALPQLSSWTVGVEGPLGELKSLFLQGHAIIGICGPGGCGKTTLAAKLCDDSQIKGIFPHYVFVTVSNAPNMLEIIKRLWLAMVDAQNEPQFPSIGDAEIQLKCNLERLSKPFLVILDDVWSEDVLQKLVVKNANIKTVVTSRTNFKVFNSVYTIKEMVKQDAIELFQHHAFAQDAMGLCSSTREKPYAGLVEMIVDGCKGHPLTLQIVGASLKDEPVWKWRMTEQLLREGRTKILRTHKGLLSCLGTSFHFLTDDLKECFMDFSLFPQAKNIPAAVLIDIWVEHRGYSENEAYAVLFELASRHLITLHERASDVARGEYESFCNLFVLQHDLLRDMAIHYSSDCKPELQTRVVMNVTDDHSNHSRQLNPQAPIVSIQVGEMDQFSWPNVQLQQTEVLILNLSADVCALPPFLNKMDNLKVLVISNSGSKRTKLTNLPDSQLKLSRIRLENVFLPTIPSFHMQFPELQKISLVCCDASDCMKTSPVGLSNIVPSLKELEVSYCNHLEELHPEVCSLTNLERLSITSCPDLIELPENLGSLRQLQELRLQACALLKDLPASLTTLRNLKFLDISHCSDIGSLPDGFGDLCCLEMIDMRRVYLTELSLSPMSLENLIRVICDEDYAGLWRAFQDRVEICTPKEVLDLNWLH